MAAINANGARISRGGNGNGWTKAGARGGPRLIDQPTDNETARAAGELRGTRLSFVHTVTCHLHCTTYTPISVPGRPDRSELQFVLVPCPAGQPPNTLFTHSRLEK
jgi:hypothetical protein